MTETLFDLLPAPAAPDDSRGSWPLMASEWREYAAGMIARFPLMGTDWAAHCAAVRGLEAPAAAPADSVPFDLVEPLSAEEEEMWGMP